VQFSLWVKTFILTIVVRLKTINYYPVKDFKFFPINRQTKIFNFIIKNLIPKFPKQFEMQVMVKRIEARHKIERFVPSSMYHMWGIIRMSGARM
jgi:hypothetical protein